MNTEDNMKIYEPVSKLRVNRFGSAGAADGATKWLAHTINCLCPPFRIGACRASAPTPWAAGRACLRACLSDYARSQATHSQAATESFKIGSYTCFLIFLLTILPANFADCADWPVWRGPGANGISKEKGWNPSAVENPVIAWSKRLGKGYSSVSIHNGNCYTAGWNAGKDTIFCLDAKFGAEKWSFTYPAPKGGGYAGPRATPVTDGKTVYFLSIAGDAYALDASDGSEKWHVNVCDSFGAENLRWMMAGSPLIHGDKIILSAGESGIALDARTGKKLWASSGVGNYATPVLFGEGRSAKLLIFSSDALKAVSPENGKVQWSYPWKTKFLINAADPAILGNNVLISSGYRRGAALLDVSGKEPKTGWTSKKFNAHFSSPVIYEGYAYGFDGNTPQGDLVCLDMRNGDIKWREEMEFGSLIIADGVIMAMTVKGTLFTAKASPDGFSEIASSKTPLRPVCWTAPVLSNGILYCRDSNGTLLAIDMKK